MTSEEQQWLEAASARLPCGARVTGTVTRVHKFGCFLHLEEHPDLKVLVDIPNYRPHGVPVASEDLPGPGTRLEGVVVGHTEWNREVRIRVGIEPGGTSMPSSSQSLES